MNNRFFYYEKQIKQTNTNTTPKIVVFPTPPFQLTLSHSPLADFLLQLTNFNKQMSKMSSSHRLYRVLKLHWVSKIMPQHKKSYDTLFEMSLLL